MKKFLFIFSILCILATTAFAADGQNDADDPAAGKKSERNLVSVSPRTLSQKFAAATLVARGTVLSITQLKEDEVEGSRRKKSSRKEFAAKIQIIDIYKGGYPEDELSVIFLRAANNEKPPLMDLEEGEEAILFLVPGSNPPYFAPVEYHYGKEPYNDENDAALKAMIANTDEEPAKVTINLSVKTESAGEDQGVFATILIMNNTAKPVRVDSAISPRKIISISDANGKQVEAIDDIYPLPEMIALKPQHFIGARYDLKKHFNLSKSGVYNVRATMIEPNWKASGAPETITSKTVSVQVD